jgi:hypothetical protein
MKRFATAAAIMALVALAAAVSGPVQARPYHWRGDFHARDIDHWRHGRWHHGHHGGRLGWWWVLGPAWYYYPAPIYPYPEIYLPPVEIETVPVPVGPPTVQYWYYCDSYNQYYPYAPNCPAGWRAVPAQPK